MARAPWHIQKGTSNDNQVETFRSKLNISYCFVLCSLFMFYGPYVRQSGIILDCDGLTMIAFGMTFRVETIWAHSDRSTNFESRSNTFSDNFCQLNLLRCSLAFVNNCDEWLLEQLIYEATRTVCDWRIALFGYWSRYISRYIRLIII